MIPARNVELESVPYSRLEPESRCLICHDEIRRQASDHLPAYRHLSYLDLDLPRQPRYIVHKRRAKERDEVARARRSVEIANRTFPIHEDIYRRAYGRSAPLELATEPRSVVLGRENHPVHESCFKDWVDQEIRAGQVPRCLCCNGSVVSVDGRSLLRPVDIIREIFLLRAVQSSLVQFVNNRIDAQITNGVPLARLVEEFPRLSFRQRGSALLTALQAARYDVFLALANGDISLRARENIAIEVLALGPAQFPERINELLAALARGDREFAGRMRQLFDRLCPRDRRVLAPALDMWKQRVRDDLNFAIEDLRAESAADWRSTNTLEYVLIEECFPIVATVLEEDPAALITRILDELAAPVMQLIRAGATSAQIREHVRQHPIGRRARGRAMELAYEAGHIRAAAVLYSLPFPLRAVLLIVCICVGSVFINIYGDRGL